LIMPDIENDMRKEANYLLDNFTVHSILFARKDYAEAYSEINGDTIVSTLADSSIDLWGEFTLNYDYDSDGAAFILEGQATDLSIIYPNDSSYSAPQSAFRKDTVVLGYPYLSELPQGLRSSLSILTDSRGINNELAEFYKDSKVIVMQAGDIISIPLDREPNIQ